LLLQDREKKGMIVMEYAMWGIVFFFFLWIAMGIISLILFKP